MEQKSSETVGSSSMKFFEYVDLGADADERRLNIKNLKEICSSIPISKI